MPIITGLIDVALLFDASVTGHGLGIPGTHSSLPPLSCPPPLPPIPQTHLPSPLPSALSLPLPSHPCSLPSSPLCPLLFFPSALSPALPSTLSPPLPSLRGHRCMRAHRRISGCGGTCVPAKVTLCACLTVPASSSPASPSPPASPSLPPFSSHA